LLIEFIQRNGGRWIPPPGGQEEIAETIENVTTGAMSEPKFMRWVAQRIGPALEDAA
jgi:hypothetical protein